MNENEILEKIVALSDGELSTDEASEVYQLLANNPKLQDELNYHLKMKNVYKKIETPPPSHLKSNILIGSGLAYVFWKTKGFLYSMISGGIAISAFLGYQLGFLSFGEENQIIESNKKYSEMIVLPELNKEYSNINSELIDLGEIYKFDVQKDENNIASNFNNNLKVNINKDKNPEYTVKNSFNIPSELSLVLSNSKNKELLVINSISSEYNEIRFQQNNILSKFNLNFRRSFVNNYEILDINNSQKLDLNFSSVSIMYEYSNNFEFGLELSGEEFAQRFRTQINDSIANYQQFFNSYYLGLTSKYYLPLELFNNDLSFFTKGLIGATSLGPVFRIELGGEYHLYDRISLIGTLELSSLIYNVNGKVNHSSRQGTTFGLKYDL